MNTKDVELNLDELPWMSSEIDWPSEKGDSNDLIPDTLATIFEGQRQLHAKYHDIERRNGCILVSEDLWGALDDRRVQMRLKDLAYRVVEELSESTNTLKNKPWKNTFVATDEEHFHEELADAFHFFVELCLTAGLTADDLFKLYFKKHQVNQFRQRSNY